MALFPHLNKLIFVVQWDAPPSISFHPLSTFLTYLISWIFKFRKLFHSFICNIFFLLSNKSSFDHVSPLKKLIFDSNEMLLHWSPSIRWARKTHSLPYLLHLQYFLKISDYLLICFFFPVYNFALHISQNLHALQ